MSQLIREDDGSSSPSYQKISSLVAKKYLALTFIFGPPRGGTTACERWMFESFDFDGNVNQPGLMARDEIGDRDRVESTWSTVLSKYNEVAQTKPEGYLVRLIVKETSNVVLPVSELGLWQRVSQCILLVFRNPILQIESRICCILNRISSGATADLGVPKNLDPRTATIGGHPLILPDSDFSFLDETSEVSLWEQYYKSMKKRRDYTSLGYGFVVYSTLHPLFEEPMIQREALTLYSKQDHVNNVTKEDIDGCIDSKLEDIQDLPSFFHEAFHSWRFGWIEFNEQVQCLFNNMDKEGYCSNIGLVDMSDLQSDPKFFFKQLKSSVGYTMKPKVEPVQVPVEESSDGGLGGPPQVMRSISNTSTGSVISAGGASSDENADAAPPPSPGFDVTSQGEAWDTWFLSSCNWDAMDASCDIRPPTKSIVNYGSFPGFLVNELQYGMDKFCELKNFKKGIELKVPLEVLRKFYGVDIIQDYINEAVFFDPSDMKRVQADTNHFGYLPMIKASLLKAGVMIPDFQDDMVTSINQASTSINSSSIKMLSTSRQRSPADCSQRSNPN